MYFSIWYCLRIPQHTHTCIFLKEITLSYCRVTPSLKRQNLPRDQNFFVEQSRFSCSYRGSNFHFPDSFWSSILLKILVPFRKFHLNSGFLSPCFFFQCKYVKTFNGNQDILILIQFPLIVFIVLINIHCSISLSYF